MENLEFLSEPAEILELADGQILEASVVDFRIGKMLIHPRYPGAPAEKLTKTIRVYVPREEKPAGMPYWDITAKTAVAQLEPIIAIALRDKKKVRIQAFGVGPSKRFTIGLI